MPTTILLPDAIIDVDPFLDVTGAASHDVALRSDDGATSFVSPAGPLLPGPLELGMDDLPALAAGLAVTAAVSAKGSGAFGEKVIVSAKLNGVPVESIKTSVTGVYATYTAPLLRPGGGTWNKNDLDLATVELSVTSLNVEVSYLAWIVDWVASSSLGGNQSGNAIDRAYLTARSGCARADASRSAFAPTATQGTTATAGKAPGTPGPYYVWRRRYLPFTNWMPVTPPASQR